MDDELRSRRILENVTMELRADGSDGVMIQQPLLMAQDTGQVMFDWRGNGWLGQSFGFDASNPHQGRLGPNVDVGATGTCHLVAKLQISSLKFWHLLILSLLSSLLICSFKIMKSTQLMVECTLQLGPTSSF